MTGSIRTPFAVSSATLLLLCGMLFAPAIASAVTVSGTVKTNGGPIAHAVSVSLYSWDGIDWQTTAYSTETTNGVWAFNVSGVEALRPCKAVFSDWPYNWYAETVYPNARLAANGIPSNGTPITPGVGNPHAATMDVLTTSATGVVKDKAGHGIPGITVTAYRGTNPESDWAGSTETQADGTYQLHGLAAGSYRIGFDDFNGRYATTYYNAKATLLTATTVALPQPTSTVLFTVMSRYVAVERIAPSGVNFWTQSVNAVRREYVEDMSKPYSTTNIDAWDDVKDIVITSGDTRAQSDPLTAAGLCWAYQVRDPKSYNASFNAPLLLVSASAPTDRSVKDLIKEIALNNAGLQAGKQRLTIHIVGGPVAVPDARFKEISDALVSAGAQAPIKDRILSTGGRFDLAAAIAKRMKASADASMTDSLTLADFALVANGADPANFYDSLALSPIAASMGAPVLLVTKTSVPVQTTQALTELKTKRTLAAPVKALYVGGGTAAVADGVLVTLRNSVPSTTRVWGSDRYQTAAAIADKALAMSWLRADSSVAIASTITDAQLGGVLAGNDGSPLLLTAPTSLVPTTKTWLTNHKTTLLRVYLNGSTTSLNPAVYNATTLAVAN